MNDKLIEIIVKGRQDSALKQSEVGKILGVKGNTISDWERGRTEPDIDSFIRLCQIYKINATEALNSVYGLRDNSDFLLTQHEAKHIKKYRALDEHGKKVTDFILDAEYDRCQAAVEIEAAREEAAPYNVIHLAQLEYNRASAGFGGEFVDDAATMVSVIGNRDTIRADFVVQVDGHSMEPEFCDGDLVLVHRQPAVDIGCIGVYAANGKGYIKRQGEDRLISINPDYPDIVPEEYEAYQCFGEVIGVLDPEWIVEK